MKKTLRILIIPLLLWGSSIKAQITLDLISPEPQTGQYNYFGVRVTLAQAYSQNVTVEGYIYDEGDPNTNHPWTLTIPAWNLTAETAVTFYQTGPATTANADISVANITATYAGVTITFELNTNMLKFASAANVVTVLDQLEADYNYHNDSYDATQDTTRTGDQQDSMDIVNGFYEFQPFVNFENLFPGFSSIRAAIEYTENQWLLSEFETTDPDDVDLTFDDAENTIFNTSYAFKVGNDVYQLTGTGLYINGILTAQTKVLVDEEIFAGVFSENENGSAESIANDESFIHTALYTEYGDAQNVAEENNCTYFETLSDCKTNKKKKADYIPVSDRKFRCKVAIHSIGVSSSIKGKVVHLKQKGGGWKRARTKLAVSVGGYVYTTSCVSLGYKADSHPNTGWKKRKQLAITERASFTIWKTYSGEVAMGFACADGYNTTLTLTW
jgi:hypothetical protein